MFAGYVLTSPGGRTRKPPGRHTPRLLSHRYRRESMVTSRSVPLLEVMRRCDAGIIRFNSAPFNADSSVGVTLIEWRKNSVDALMIRYVAQRCSAYGASAR